MNKIYFTSDTHFGHKKIIGFCSRPYADITEHDEALIANWNATVPKDGIVYHLGDFSFASTKYTKSIIERLNGEIHLILGNHDYKNILSQKLDRCFASAQQQKHIIIGNTLVWMNHFPYLCFNGTYNKDSNIWQLFGHVHSGPNSTSKDTSRLDMLFPNQYDVGVDNNNYRPISFDEVAEKIKQQYNK